jgi:hypothetical protein
VNLQIETFVGATYPNSALGLYRGGLLFFYSTGLGGEFFTQIGVPRWDPETDADFTMDLFYLLFEPRVRVDLFSIALTFFWHPQYYEQAETNEAGTLEFFIKFMYGDIRKTRLSGGVENRLTLQTRSGDQYSFRVSPFLAVATSGVVWDLRINLQVQPYELDELVQTYFGIKTQL